MHVALEIEVCNLQNVQYLAFAIFLNHFPHFFGGSGDMYICTLTTGSANVGLVFDPLSCWSR